jgi:hypothetical protein
MKPILLFLAAAMLLCSSCRWMGYKRIKGNGNIITQDIISTVQNGSHLKAVMIWRLHQGPVTSIKIEADENFIPFIFVSEKDGFLVIKSKDHVNLVSEHNIKVYITTPKLEQVELSGSGNIIGKNKFTGGDKMY